MVKTVQRGKFMAQHMGRPILRHAGADQAVQRQGCRPHQIAAHGVILRLLQCPGPLFDQRQQQSFGKAVLHLRIRRIGEVLFGDVHERIDHAVGYLACWQGICFGRIQHRKQRVDQRACKNQLVVAGASGNHGTAVHLRPRRRKR